MIYYSDFAVKCTEDSSTLMWLMSVFLLLGTLKLVLFGIVLVLLVGILVWKCMKDRNKRMLSKEVIRSLTSFRYHALMD